MSNSKKPDLKIAADHFLACEFAWRIYRLAIHNCQLANSRSAQRCGTRAEAASPLDQSKVFARHFAQLLVYNRDFIYHLICAWQPNNFLIRIHLCPSE